MTKEHDLINRYFAPLCSGPSVAPAFGLLDDTALLAPAIDQQLLITTDALVAEVHFFADDAADTIAHKALAVNVSDIVAKGGQPTSYLLTIALPKNIDADWLAQFADGLGAAQQAFGCELVGGDTVSTSGPLMISITMLGNIDRGKMVKRNGAAPGDVVFVSGSIGDAALGLLVRRKTPWAANAGVDKRWLDYLRERYLRPLPRVEIASQIAAYASAAMDVSDGLLGDFDKLCAASDVGGVIEIARVPLSDAATSVVANNPELMETVLTGGDDYEVLATVPADLADRFEQEALNVTRIGLIVERQNGLKVLDADGQLLELAQSAYDHFGDIER